MLAQNIFRIDMALGYLAWALCIATYVWPRLKAMDRVEAHRAIATLHSFRFFGLAFLLSGFVGPNLPEAFATPADSDDVGQRFRLKADADSDPRRTGIPIDPVQGRRRRGY